MNDFEPFNRLHIFIGENHPISDKAKMVENWIIKQGLAFDENERNELANLACSYLLAKEDKEDAMYKNTKTSKTYNERVKKGSTYALKLVSLLSEAGGAPVLMKGIEATKAYMLSNMLTDLYLHPEDYFYNVEKISANLDDIKDFFSRVSIEKIAKKELFNILTS